LIFELTFGFPQCFRFYLLQYYSNCVRVTPLRRPLGAGNLVGVAGAEHSIERIQRVAEITPHYYCATTDTGLLVQYKQKKNKASKRQIEQTWVARA
jgi:hypothetical protein